MQALQHRKKGNKFYTEKDFPAALGSYMRANQQSPGDIFILTNLVAASVRLGNYTLAVSPCPSTPPFHFPLCPNTLSSGPQGPSTNPSPQEEV
jgi:hypothetical protein